MSRSFDFTVDSSASVEQICAAFANRDYWQARLSSFGGLGDLESLVVDPDGSVTAVCVKDLRPDGLPGPAARLFPREWRVVQSESWRPLGDGRVCGEVRLVSHGAPGSGAGSALLTPTVAGCRLTCRATVEFNVPLIGGQIEGVMGKSLIQNITMLQRFTADWIKQNA